MKTTLIKIVFTLLMLAMFLSGCKKDPHPIELSHDDPQGGTEQAIFSFKSNLDLSGQPYHSSNLTAVISVKNHAGFEVIKDSVIQITLNEGVKTTHLKLPLGSYTLTKFRLEYGSASTHFAAPLVGSQKAALVQHPLAFDFELKNAAITEIPIEVLKVNQGDIPEDFGYPSGTFDYGREDAEPFIKIKVQPIMQVGDVLYDSIPASLKLTTHINATETNISYLSLAAGINVISLPKAAIKYDLQVSKWGTTDAISINRQDVDRLSVYTLGGNMAPKKLKSEVFAKLVNGIFVAESKTNYLYNASGNIDRIEYLLKRADQSIYVAMTDRFEYAGQKVQKITRFDEQVNQLLYSTVFIYDLQGRVVDIIKVENGTTLKANISYYTFTRPEIKISFNYPRSMDLEYNSTYFRGNLHRSSARRSNGDTELGYFEHDFNINPYKHMNWPDLNLSHFSKNNRTSERIEYYGSYPTLVPDSFAYTYDAEGYPTTLTKTFKSYQTGKPALTTKTTYTY